MEVKIGVSARHVHLNKEDFKALFGEASLTKLKDLSQKGEFAAEEKVNLITEKNKIDGVRILGPLRNYTQVEVSKTDAYALGINPPVRNSGDLMDSEIVTIEYNGKTITKPCCIIATRHIHVNSSDLEKYRLKDGEVVKLKLPGIKGGVLNNVYIKSNEKFVLEAHIDVDDANSHLINNGDSGEIINE